MQRKGIKVCVLCGSRCDMIWEGEGRSDEEVSAYMTESMWSPRPHRVHFRQRSEAGSMESRVCRVRSALCVSVSFSLSCRGRGRWNLVFALA